MTATASDASPGIDNQPQATQEIDHKWTEIMHYRQFPAVLNDQCFIDVTRNEDYNDDGGCQDPGPGWCFASDQCPDKVVKYCAQYSAQQDLYDQYLKGTSNNLIFSS